MSTTARVAQASRLCGHPGMSITRRDCLRVVAGTAAGAWAGSLIACERQVKPESVVAYCSVDADVAQPIFEAFEKSSGIRVDAVYDTEATKTTGLVNRLLGEKERPRADVWWSSEPLGTIRLARAGVLTPGAVTTELSPAHAADGSWGLLARRRRELVFNTTLVQQAEAPNRLAGLLDARWKDRIVMARPQFGTTRTHIAALVHAHGIENTESFLRSLKSNGVCLLDGNSAVVRTVASGGAALGLTDSDDVLSGQANSWSISSIPIGNHMVALTHDRFSRGELFPESALQIPGTAAFVRGGPSPDRARVLLKYLLGKEVDDALTRSPFATWPMRGPTAAESVLGEWRDDRKRPWLPVMDIDFEAVASNDAQAMAICDRVFGS